MYLRHLETNGLCFLCLLIMIFSVAIR